MCVVTIAGPCRDGKSYILGEVFGQTNVFSLGHEMDPETMGLWMHIVPQKVKVRKQSREIVLLLFYRQASCKDGGRKNGMPGKCEQY